MRPLIKPTKSVLVFDSQTLEILQFPPDTWPVQAILVACAMKSDEQDELHEFQKTYGYKGIANLVNNLGMVRNETVIYLDDMVTIVEHEDRPADIPVDAIH